MSFVCVYSVTHIEVVSVSYLVEIVFGIALTGENGIIFGCTRVDNHVFSIFKSNLYGTRGLVNGENKSEYTRFFDIKSDIRCSCPIYVFKSVVGAVCILNDDLVNGSSIDLGFNAYFGNVRDLLGYRKLHFVVKLVGVCVENVCKIDIIYTLFLSLYQGYIRNMNIFLHIETRVHIDTNSGELAPVLIRIVKLNVIGMIFTVGNYVKGFVLGTIKCSLSFSNIEYCSFVNAVGLHCDANVFILFCVDI